MDSTTLKVGDQAPDWTLTGTEGDVHLASFQGQKNVVLLFYPLDFSPVCSLQLPSYQARKPEFDQRDTEIFGISTDSKWSHKAFSEQLGLEYQLLSDYQRHVSEAYGVLRPEGFTNRAVFVIDKAGIIRHVSVTNPGQQPDQNEVIRVLETL
ncbi:MAG TPA: peroxiredoxin [Herpetosiphon sp.]|uniref:Alkyl hydroperoxide reductase/ Thiol specific antioxidant/ Mal allergen n=1 Tax=Herpetosiphon aurantiacus (strain ATCC 23779 / DSM 785 / 114-95) TaxID=316274 RepID=A9B2W7_HERA2|nr:peroxiredoxin [Herpetosiphon sp.]ABX06030.1 alkyl hydroperoxide reductase/ Thiol specific antioxidant/ Mal allergen [Herpetosiphon aurantiacus DSM 785]HBW49464.1 peroxiredoxin [Herpetosiphon sp.]